jgi:hypothetical protein
MKEIMGSHPTFHVVNTNMRYDKEAHRHMLKEHEACAYEERWKGKIKNIAKADVVFLYQSFGPGIVAFGVARGEVIDRSTENSCCMKLERFHRIYPPISAAEISRMNGSPVAFGQTWQRPGRELALKLYEEALRRSS